MREETALSVMRQPKLTRGCRGDRTANWRRFVGTARKFKQATPALLLPAVPQLTRGGTNKTQFALANGVLLVPFRVLSLEWTANSTRTVVRWYETKNAGLNVPAVPLQGLTRGGTNKTPSAFAKTH
jgi:hypothetical protein